MMLTISFQSMNDFAKSFWPFNISYSKPRFVVSSFTLAITILKVALIVFYGFKLASHECQISKISTLTLDLTL